jgi:hypothetical protein
VVLTCNTFSQAAAGTAFGLWDLCVTAPDYKAPNGDAKRRSLPTPFACTSADVIIYQNILRKPFILYDINIRYDMNSRLLAGGASRSAGCFRRGRRRLRASSGSGRLPRASLPSRPIRTRSETPKIPCSDCCLLSRNPDILPSQPSSMMLAAKFSSLSECQVHTNPSPALALATSSTPISFKGIL